MTYALIYTSGFGIKIGLTIRGEYKAKKNFLGRPHKIAILDLDAPMFFQPGHLNKFLTQF